MSQSYLDQLIAKMVLGFNDQNFKPSSNEKDAWSVVSWMHFHDMTIDIKRFSPIEICEQALEQVVEESELCAQA